jgi:hypothetical protein
MYVPLCMYIHERVHGTYTFMNVNICPCMDIVPWQTRLLQLHVCTASHVPVVHTWTCTWYIHVHEWFRFGSCTWYIHVHECKYMPVYGHSTVTDTSVQLHNPSGISIVSYVRHILGICLTYSRSLLLHMPGIYLKILAEIYLYAKSYDSIGFNACIYPFWSLISLEHASGLLNSCIVFANEDSFAHTSFRHHQSDVLQAL